MPKPYSMAVHSDGSVDRISGEGQPSLMMQLLMGNMQAMLAQRDREAAESQVTDTQLMPDDFVDPFAAESSAAVDVNDSQPAVDLDLPDSQPPAGLDASGDDAPEDDGTMSDNQEEKTAESQATKKSQRNKKKKKVMKSWQFHAPRARASEHLQSSTLRAVLTIFSQVA